ncbi:MAG TPA: hypothetical protein VFZ66_12375 [Herpetosiphonaceae bacterium]
MAELQRADSIDPAAPTLVVVVNNRRDWQRVCEEQWYRIPLSRAPHPVAALYLAFYLTRPLGAAVWQVGFYAPALRYNQMTRRELLPDEPDHPRAAEQYYRVALGPVQRLAHPIPSRRLRRITFIPTTFGRLSTAADVADLWQPDDATEVLWADFRDAALKATKRLSLFANSSE